MTGPPGHDRAQVGRDIESNERSDVRRQMWITAGLLVATVGSTTAAGVFVSDLAQSHWNAQRHRTAVELGIFLVLFLALVYGSIVYQLTRIGRLLKARAAARRNSGRDHALHSEATVGSFGETAVPPVAVLVPAFKEEPSVVMEAILSALLQVYAKKRVVLLLDDPPISVTDSDEVLLRAARQMPARIASIFGSIENHVRREAQRFGAQTTDEDFDRAVERERLARLYEWVADEIEVRLSSVPTSAFFRNSIVGAAAEGHRERADNVRRAATLGDFRQSIAACKA